MKSSLAQCRGAESDHVTKVSHVKSAAREATSKTASKGIGQPGRAMKFSALNHQLRECNLTDLKA
jgi:hypothetical protein